MDVHDVDRPHSVTNDPTRLPRWKLHMTTQAAASASGRQIQHTNSVDFPLDHACLGSSKVPDLDFVADGRQPLTNSSRGLEHAVRPIGTDIAYVRDQHPVPDHMKV